MAIREHRIDLKGLRRTQRVLASDAQDTALPVLMLHGNPDNADEWRNLMDQLSPDYRCLAPDLPGYGVSKAPPASFRYTVEDQIQFVDELLDAIGITEPIILVVHDIGGMAGIPWAAKNLHRVHGLVITNTIAYEHGEWFKTVRLWGTRNPFRRIHASWLMVVAGLFKGRIFRRIFAQQNPQLTDHDLDRMIDTFCFNRDAKASTLRQFREATKPDFFDGFDAMNAAIHAAVPVRVVWGDDDPYIDTKYAWSFATKAVTLLDGVGHWPPIVRPDVVADAVRQVARPG